MAFNLSDRISQRQADDGNLPPKPKTPGYDYAKSVVLGTPGPTLDNERMIRRAFDYHMPIRKPSRAVQRDYRITT